MSCFVQWNLSRHNSLPDNNFHSPCTICHILLFLLAWWWAPCEVNIVPSTWASKDFIDRKTPLPHNVMQGEKPFKGPGFGGWLLLYHILAQSVWHIGFFNILHRILHACKNITKCKNVNPILFTFYRLLKQNKKSPFINPRLLYMLKKLKGRR